MTVRLATVFGGSGFVGRHIVQRLLSNGWRVRVAVRDPEGAHFLRPLGNVGQMIPVAADLGNEASIEAALAGAALVVNAVGILTERRRGDFQAIHVEGAARIARAAARAGVGCLVHVSALGADAGSASAYGRSKAEGEAAVQAAFPRAIVLRPSVVFGPEDDFINRFAAMTSISPVLPVIVTDGPLCHSGGARLQPVYVGDVADAVLAAIASPEAAGRIFELGGPEVLSLKQVMALVLKGTGRKRFLLPLPLWLARLQAGFLQFLPNPPLTPDQLKMLEKDNVVSGSLPGLADLGITPKACEGIVETYLRRFRNVYAPAA